MELLRGFPRGFQAHNGLVRALPVCSPVNRGNRRLRNSSKLLSQKAQFVFEKHQDAKSSRDGESQLSHAIQKSVVSLGVIARITRTHFTCGDSAETIREETTFHPQGSRDDSGTVL